MVSACINNPLGQWVQNLVIWSVYLRKRPKLQYVTTITRTHVMSEYLYVLYVTVLFLHSYSWKSKRERLREREKEKIIVFVVNVKLN